MSLPLPKYPLQQLLKIKEDRAEEARKVVKQKEEELKKEEEALQKLEKERDKALNHHKDKLLQYRKELDGGTTSEKVTQMKAYLDVTKEKLKAEEAKVKKQLERVQKAQTELENAQTHLKAKIQEVEKIKTHREYWTKETKKELEILEERELDETGSLIHNSQTLKKHKS
ncbi:MAG: hypothetical protein K0S74_114 [Chlamydiales bacterium]|jgi:DNA repair exonuclease SbcCD ATPase subunit|nr:hypothetical protein [Chlamydiales bacterium]